MPKGVSMDNKFKFFSDSFSAGNKADIDLIAIIILVVLIVLFIVYLIVNKYLKKEYGVSSKESVKFRKSEFNSLCKSVGLNSEESRVFFKLVVKYRIRSPLLCFTNIKLLDEILKKGLDDIENDNNQTHDNKAYNNFLLLELRAKIEERLKKNTGIRIEPLCRKTLAK